MQKRFLVPLVNKFLCSFIEDLNPTDLSLSLWKGSLCLSNIVVKPSFLAGLSIPISVKSLSLGKLYLSIPWMSMSTDPITILLEDIYINTSLKPSNKEPKEETSQSSLESKSVTESVPAAAESNANKASSSTFNVMNFADIFPLLSSLVNHIMIDIKRVHIRVEDDDYHGISPFSFGLFIESLSLSSPDLRCPTVHQVLSLRGLSLYWNPSSSPFPDNTKSDIVCSLRSSDSKWCIIDNFGLELDIQGNLSRVEDRKRDVQVCLEAASLPNSLTNRVNALSLSTISSYEEFVEQLSLSEEEHHQYGEQINELWNSLSTPSPLSSIALSIGSLNVKVAESQIRNVLDVLSAFSSNSASSDEKPSIKNEEPAPAVADVVEENVAPQETCETYPFGAIPCILFIVNSFYAHSSMWYYLVRMGFTFPLLFIQPLLYLSLFIPVVLFIICSAVSIYTYYKKLNKSVNKDLHEREQYSAISLHWDGFNAAIVDDRNSPEVTPLSVHILPIEASCSVGKDAQIVHCVAEGLTVIDGVTSLSKSRDCCLLCTAPISHLGEALPSKVPLLEADIRMDSEGLSLGVALGDLNVIISPMLFISLLKLIPPQLLEGGKASKPKSPAVTKVEKPVNEKEENKMNIHFSATLSSVGLLVDTDAAFPLCYCVLNSFSASGSLSPSIELAFSLQKVEVIDTTQGAGEYSSVVCLSNKDDLPFIKGSLGMAASLAVSCDIGELGVALRMRFVKEAMSYLTRGSLPLLLSLVQDMFASSSDAVAESSLDVPSDEALICETSTDVASNEEKSTAMLINVSIAGVSLVLPKASASRDKFVLAIGGINVCLKDCIDVSLQYIRGYSEFEGVLYSIIADFGVNVHLDMLQGMKVGLMLSPIVLMASENNLLNIINLLISNLGEKAFLDDILPCPEAKTSSNPSSSSKSTSSKEANQSSDSSTAKPDDSLMDIHVELGGFGVLFASSDDAIQGNHKGIDFMSPSLDITGGLFMFSLQGLDLSCLIHGPDIHLACSLCSLGLRDIRSDSMLFSNFRYLLNGGCDQKPFLSVLMDLSSGEPLSSIDVSARVGTISVIPTSFIFSILDGVLPFVQHLLSRIQSIDIKELLPFGSSASDSEEIPVEVVEEEEEPSSNSSQQKIHAAVSLEGVSVGVVENPELQDSPVFLLSIGVNAEVDISPSMDMNVTASLTEVRACRSNAELILPSTDMSDAIAPFSMSVSLSQKDANTDISVNMAPLLLRLGVLDIKLFTNFISHLLPKKDVIEDSEKPLDSEMASIPAEAKESEASTDATGSETATEGATPTSMNLSLSCPEVLLLLVNDRFEFELPVLQLCVSNMAVSLSLGSALTLHTSISLSGDYYKQSAAVWEPYLEPWTLSVNIGPEEADDSSVFKLVDTAMCISVEAADLLYLNVTSPLLSSLTRVVDFITECSESSHVRGENCFVAIENRTGYPMTAQVIEDGKVNHDLVVAAANKQAVVRDFIVWEGLVCSPSCASHLWMEIHTTSPFVRVFKSIPLDSMQFLAAADTMDRSGYSFALSSDINIIAKTEQQADEWEQCVGREVPSVVSLGIPAISDENVNQEILVQSDVAVSPLLAHPSMALRFVGLAYQHLPERVLSLCVEGFDPIQCAVDKERDVYVPLKDKEGHEYNAILHNEVRDGRKIISLSSTICVENQTDLDIHTRFSSLEWGGEPVVLKKYQSHYCPLSIADNAALHLSVMEYEASEIVSLRQLSKGHIPSSLNIGTALNPCIVRLVLHRSSLYDTLSRRFVETYRICLVPELTFVNMLPVPLEYRLVNGETIIKEDTLDEGSSVILYGSNVNPSLPKEEQILRIRIRPKGSATFSLFDESILPNLGAGQSCLVYDEHNLPLRLSYDVSLSREGIVTVQVFADFWIVNRTNEELIVTEKKDSSSVYRTIPAQAATFAPLSQYDATSGSALQPFLFSCAKSDPSASIFIRTTNSQWSEKLGIGAVGTTGVTAIRPEEGSDDTQLKVFGLSITSAPSIFGLSKVVTISASMILFNATGSPLRMRQVQTDTPVIVNPDVPLVFHWPNKDAPLAVEFEKNDGSWTDTCKLEVGESLHLLDEATRRVLRVNCMMDMEHVSVVIDYAGKFNTDLFMQQLECPDETIDYHQLLQNDMTPVEQQNLSLHLSVKMRGIGISLIDSVPREILFLTLQDLGVSLDMSDKGAMALTACITKFQIDNSLSGAHYPVMLGSLSAGEKEGEESVNQLLKVSLMMSQHPSVIVLDYLGVMLLPLTISVDSPLITAIFELLNDISMIPSQVEALSGRAILDHAPVLHSCVPFVNVVTPNYCYLQELMLQPISIKISVHNDPSAPLTADLLPSTAFLLPFKAVLNTVISLVANLNNATLQLDSFAMETSYLSMSTLIGKLISHYVKQVISKIYLLLGAFNLLGNPVELVGNISEGVHALFFEPVNALLKQPNEFVGSVGKGTTKLVSMTAYGLLDSVSKITGTVTNGIASLNMSQSYQADRAAGKTGVVHGLTSGVKGLVKDTTAGFREDGIIGLAKGLGTGLAGVVLNPVTGAIESVTGAVNSVKNRIHEEKTLQRVREPRLIPLDGFLLPYNSYLAEGVAMLALVNRTTTIELAKHEKYVYHIPVDDGARVLLMTTLQLMVLSSKGHMEHHVRYEKVEVKRDGNWLRLIAVGNKKEIQKDGLLMQSEEVAAMIAITIQMIPVSTLDSIAARVRTLVEEIRPLQLAAESMPAIDTLAIDAVKYVSRTTMRAGESYNEDKKRKHVMYKIEVSGGGVLWNVYFRYTNLELLHASLKSKVEELGNLTVLSKVEKMLNSKQTLELSVKRYMQEITNMKEVLALEEVDAFFKHNAFDMRWNETADV